MSDKRTNTGDFVAAEKTERMARHHQRLSGRESPFIHIRFSREELETIQFLAIYYTNKGPLAVSPSAMSIADKISAALRDVP